jgi:transcriptional regulator with XRE-family HTH domain
MRFDEAKELRKQVGQLFAELRAERSAGEIADYVGISHAEYQEIERGTTTISLITLMLVSEALGTKASELLRIAKSRMTGTEITADEKT